MQIARSKAYNHLQIYHNQIAWSMTALIKHELSMALVGIPSIDCDDRVDIRMKVVARSRGGPTFVIPSHSQYSHMLQEHTIEQSNVYEAYLESVIWLNHQWQ